MYDVYYTFDDDGQVYEGIITSRYKSIQVNVSYIKKFKIKNKQVFLGINKIKKVTDK